MERKGNLGNNPYGRLYDDPCSQDVNRPFDQSPRGRSSIVPSAPPYYPDHEESFGVSASGINRSVAPYHGDQQLESQLEIEAEKLNIPKKVTSILHQLREYCLLFIIDDSGSMSVCDTKLSCREENGDEQLSRMEELKLRFKAMVPLLAAVSGNGLIIKTLNNSSSVTIHERYSYKEKVKKMISAINKVRVGGSTPLITSLTDSFQHACNKGKKTIAYVMTDGVPTDKSLLQSPEKAVSELFTNFRECARGSFFPINLMPCTGNDADVGWMNKIDKEIENIQVTDDYFSELKEVYNAHGSWVKYTYGLYMAVSLAAPINALLDRLDENKFLTIGQLETLNGYTLSSQEYAKYKNEASEARNKAGGYKHADGEMHPVNNTRILELNDTTLYRVGIIDDANKYSNNGFLERLSNCECPIL